MSKVLLPLLVLQATTPQTMPGAQVGTFPSSVALGSCSCVLPLRSCLRSSTRNARQEQQHPCRSVGIHEPAACQCRALLQQPQQLDVAHTEGDGHCTRGSEVCRFQHGVRRGGLTACSSLAHPAQHALGQSSTVGKGRVESFITTYFWFGVVLWPAGGPRTMA